MVWAREPLKAIWVTLPIMLKVYPWERVRLIEAPILACRAALFLLQKPMFPLSTWSITTMSSMSLLFSKTHTSRRNWFSKCRCSNNSSLIRFLTNMELRQRWPISPQIHRPITNSLWIRRLQLPPRAALQVTSLWLTRPIRPSKGSSTCSPMTI